MKVSELKKDVKELKDLLAKAAEPKSQVSSEGLIHGGFGVSKGLQGRHWNEDPRLEVLSKAYNPDIALQLLHKGFNNSARVTGIGPALVKMAGIAVPSIAVDKNYTMDQLEKEHGFVPYSRATKSMGNEVRKVALAESSGSTGGYIIPPQFMTELLTIAAEDAFIEQRAKKLPMNTRTAEWPMLDITTAQATGVSPYFGGIVAQWQPEAATINETEPTFRSSTWTAWDLVLYTLSSNQLLADNGIGLDALLTQLFAQAMTWYKEFAFLNGRGAGNSMPMGVLNATASILVNRSAGTTFKLQDAANMMARLHVRSWKSACWVMHQSVLPQLIQMVDNGTSNRLVWLNAVMPGDSGPAANTLPMNFFGLPIYFTEKVPVLGTRGDVMLIDWSRYVIGNRLDFQIDVSPHYRFQNNQLAWRVVARCDGKPWLNSSITDAQGYTSSPFIILN